MRLKARFARDETLRRTAENRKDETSGAPVLTDSARPVGNVEAAVSGKWPFRIAPSGWITLKGPDGFMRGDLAIGLFPGQACRGPEPIETGPSRSMRAENHQPGSNAE